MIINFPAFVFIFLFNITINLNHIFLNNIQNLKNVQNENIHTIEAAIKSQRFYSN